MIGTQVDTQAKLPPSSLTSTYESHSAMSTDPNESQSTMNYSESLTLENLSFRGGDS